MASRFFHGFIVSGITPILLMTNTALAEGLTKRFESALLVPWQTVTDAAIDSLSSEDGQVLKMNLPSQAVVVNDIPVELSGIQVLVNGKLNHTPNENSANPDVHWEAKDLNVQILVESFQVSQVIEEWVSGVRLRVHLEAKCSEISLEQSSAHLMASLLWTSSGTSLEAKVSQMSLDWPAQSWKIHPIHCEGPRGFGELVQKELNDQLSDSSRWTDVIKAEMEAHLNASITEALNRLKKPTPIYSDEQTELRLVFSGVDTITEKGLVLKGFVQVGDEVIGDSMIVPLDVEKAMQGVTTKTPLLLIPGYEMAVVTQRVARNREIKYDLRSISSFTDLLRVRFFQFFIWPDLMNYSTQSSFPVITRIGSQPRVGYGSHYLRLSGDANSWIYSQRSGQSWRYIDVKTTFSGVVLPRIEDGKLKLEVSQKKIQSAAQMAADYVRRFNPSRYLPMSIVNSSLENSPIFNKAEIEIPKIELNSEQIYSAKKMHYFSKDLYVIELKKH